MLRENIFPVDYQSGQILIRILLSDQSCNQNTIVVLLPTQLYFIHLSSVPFILKHSTAALGYRGLGYFRWRQFQTDNMRYRIHSFPGAQSYFVQQHALTTDPYQTIILVLTASLIGKGFHDWAVEKRKTALRWAQGYCSMFVCESGRKRVALICWGQVCLWRRQTKATTCRQESQRHLLIFLTDMPNQ